MSTPAVQESVKPQKDSSNKKSEEAERDPDMRYQFKPNLARIIGFDGWASEKEIKLKIQEYSKARKIYDSEKKILDLSK
jgi:hypothetical protein